MDERELRRRKYLTGYVSEYYLKTGNSQYIKKEVDDYIENMEKEIKKNTRKRLKKGDDISEYNIVFI